MEGPFLELISVRHRREYMVERLRAQPEWAAEAIRLGLSPEQPVAWRAVWVLREALPHEVWLPHVDAILEVLPRLGDGHQREWLKALVGCPFTEEPASRYFEVCLDLWSQVGKAPGLRMTAFLGLVELVKRYPELRAELDLVTETEYLESLSPGIANSVRKRLAQLRKG